MTTFERQPAEYLGGGASRREWSAFEPIYPQRAGHFHPETILLTRRWASSSFLPISMPSMRFCWLNSCVKPRRLKLWTATNSPCSASHRTHPIPVSAICPQPPIPGSGCDQYINLSKNLMRRPLHKYFAQRPSVCFALKSNAVHGQIDTPV